MPKRQKKLVTRASATAGAFGLIHSDQGVSDSLDATCEGPCYVNDYVFKRSPDIILVHLAPSSGPRVATGCRAVALWAPFLTIGSCFELVEFLSKFIQGFLNIQANS
jgi:hypothetical protein